MNMNYLILCGLNPNNDYGYADIGSCRAIKLIEDNRQLLIYKSFVMLDVAVKVANVLKINKKNVELKFSGNLDCIQIKNDKVCLRIDVVDGLPVDFSLSDFDNKMDYDSLEDIKNCDIAEKLIKEMNKKS